MRLLALAPAVLVLAPSIAAADDGCARQGAQQQGRKSTYKQVVKPGETLEATVKCPRARC